jgi:hypothetical protein
MSTRQYLDYRYAVPGFSFILIIIAINHVPILIFLKNAQASETFGAFLAFLSLFAGSAMGFLISQFWWWWLHDHRFLGRDEAIDVSKEIYKKYLQHSKETEDDIVKHTKERIEHIESIWEWIVRQNPNDKLFKLCEGRWDMYNVLQSTKLALIAGAVVGIICRKYCHCYLPNAKFPVAFEAWAFILIFVGWSLLLVVIWKSPNRLVTQYSPLMKAIVLDASKPKDDAERKIRADLIRIFPSFNIRTEEELTQAS